MVVNKITYNYFNEKLASKYSGIDLEKKVAKCSRGAFKVLYFSFTSFFGIVYVLRDTHFGPPEMFGNGMTMTMFGDWPFVQMPYLLKFYYLLSFSYYVEDGIMHMIQTPNFDYWEMVLHHVVTSMLIFSSYMNGVWNIGILVLIQMDVEDIFIGAIRAIMDYSNIYVILL